MEDESKQIPLRFSASEIIVGEKCRFETFELNRMGNTQNHKKGSSSSNEIKDDNKNWATVDREKIATGLLTSEDIRPRFGSKHKDDAKSIGVTVTPFKPIRRHHGIPRWSNLIRNTAPDNPATIAHMMSHLSVGQDVMSLTLKVTYRKKLIKFWLPCTSEIIKLKEEVSKRLNLQPACFNVEYKDEKGDWIIMNCNEDLRNHLQLFCSKGDQVVRLRAVDT